VSSAYEQCLDMNDDLYLLRLLLMAEPNFSELTYESVRELWRRFTIIYQSNFIEIASIGILEQAS